LITEPLIRTPSKTSKMPKVTIDKLSGRPLLHTHELTDIYNPIKVTHSELITLINTSKLITGALYQITDYVTTTAQADTVSAGNQFDLIVLAISESTISEDAKAVLHEGDTYFSGRANLAAWEIKYTPFNDTSKFAWADEANGKGVIYFLKDEWSNECPYDFKNIQFARTAGGIVPQTDNYFTFTWVNEDDQVEDLSLIGNTIQNDEGMYNGVFNNKINNCSGNAYPYVESIFALSNNIFINEFSYDSGFFYGCYSNTLGIDCHSNTFSNQCYYNTLGNKCTSNTFINNCYYNTFGNYCNSNTFGNYCYSNTFGNSCNSNTFGNSCIYNTFGNSCIYNTFGNKCYYNTFGNYCYSNTFGNYCYSNNFGNNCNSNTFAGNTKYLNLIRVSKDLSLITEIINKSYPHEIIGTDGGKALIKWYDSSGTLQTQLVS